MVMHYDSQRPKLYLERDSSLLNATQLDACNIIKHSESSLPETDDIDNYGHLIIASTTAG